MYKADNHKAFEVPKNLWEKWETMTDRGDYAGRNYEVIAFMRKGLEKIGSPLAEVVYDLECKAAWIVGERQRNGGLNGNEVTKSEAYYKMALECVYMEAGSTGGVHIETGK